MENRKVDLFVPGRLCLFGEHSDWAGTNKAINAEIIPGRAIVTGIEQGIYGWAEKADNFSVTSEIPEYRGSSFSCDMNLDKLREEAHQGGYFSYVAGVASYICEWYSVGGVHLEITEMDLPMKKGLSSSAAICVMVAKAFNELYHLNLNTMGIMNIAYWGEQRTPSRCGRLDQACAFGVRPVSMVFDGNEITVDRISVKKPLYYVFADLNAGKNTVKILADLNSAYPFARTEKERMLHEALGIDNRAVTARAVEYIENGEAEKLGSLMIEAQRIFDKKVAPMCIEELKAPVLHTVFNDEKVKALTYGAKGVGSQGDGTVQLLAKDEQTQSELFDYLNSLGMTAHKLTLKPNKVIRKAVIPVAGFGTRLYPETRFVKKEFCPVIDSDGLVKPILLVLLEELDSIEIEEVCLVINPEERELYEELLLKPLSDKHYSKLTPQMRSYEDKIRRMTRKIKFAFQEEPKGFGHAVCMAADFAGGEPVLLMLGDTIYQSNTDTPCTKQLINAYEMFGSTMVALHRIPLEKTGSYGLFSGSWENKDETIMRCTRIVEKPDAEYAKEYLNVPMRKSPENYFGSFGAYILNNDVFKRLKYAVDNNIVNSKGEVELTDAIGYVCENGSALGCVIDGISYDLGNAEAYRSSITMFGR